VRVCVYTRITLKYPEAAVGPAAKFWLAVTEEVESGGEHSNFGSQHLLL